MKVLLTGAFGRLGEKVAEQLLARGHTVRCVDLDTPASRRVASAFDGRCEIRFGDLTAVEDFRDLLDGVEGVIHLAALLPPATETQVALAQRLNVEVTHRLIEAIASRNTPPHLIYPSSVSVFARTQDRPRPRRADDPVQATDNYTRHKLEIEELLKTRTFAWNILRVGVAVDSRTLSADRQTFRKLLNTAADGPVEWVHPKDVALAMCRCLEVPESRQRTLLIGGGPACQVTQARFLGVAFRALGLHYPEQVHGQDYFYMHWMDTRETEALLQYQRHDFSDYEKEMRARLRPYRRLLRPLRGIINPLLEPLLRRV